MAVRQLSSDPLPANMKEAWEQYRDLCNRVFGAEAKPDVREAFYCGAIAAVHQLNAGRYLEVATFLNSHIFKGQGLSDSEIIDTVNALMDGTYPNPPGYPTETPLMPKPG